MPGWFCRGYALPKGGRQSQGKIQPLRGISKEFSRDKNRRSLRNSPSKQRNPTENRELIEIYLLGNHVTLPCTFLMIWDIPLLCHTDRPRSPTRRSITLCSLRQLVRSQHVLPREPLCTGTWLLEMSLLLFIA